MRKIKLTKETLKEIRLKNTGVTFERVVRSCFCPGCSRYQNQLVQIYNMASSRLWFFVCDNCLLDMYLKIGDILEIDTITEAPKSSNPKGFTPWYGGDEQIHKALLRGQRFAAIKRWRELTGDGPINSKKCINKIIQDLGSRFGSLKVEPNVVRRSF